MNNKSKKLKGKAKGPVSKDNGKKVSPEQRELEMKLFTQQSDELAAEEAKKRKERQKIKVQFLNGAEINIDDYVANEMAAHITRFEKSWFYRLADLYNVDRAVMDTYVKPDWVRRFIISFVYARFPRLLLRTLRSRNRKLKEKAGMLHQHLKAEACDKLISVIKDVFDMMGKSDDPLDFKMKYSKEHTVFFQTELF